MLAVLMDEGGKLITLPNLVANSVTGDLDAARLCLNGADFVADSVSQDLFCHIVFWLRGLLWRLRALVPFGVSAHSAPPPAGVPAWVASLFPSPSKSNFLSIPRRKRYESHARFAQDAKDSRKP